MRSAATWASTAGTSNTGSGTIVAPLMKQAMIPALYPKVWKNGFTTR